MITANELTLLDVMDEVGDKYLSLSGENYLDDSSVRADVRGSLFSVTTAMLERSRHDIIIELVRSRDWREVIVGVYCVAVSNILLKRSVTTLDIPEDIAKPVSSLFSDAVGNVFCPQSGKLPKPLVASSCCIALTLWQSSDPIERFLQIGTPYSDCLDVYAASFMAMLILDGKQEDFYPAADAAMKQDPSYTEQGFRDLKQRFADALLFWRPTSRGISDFSRKPPLVKEYMNGVADQPTY